MADVAKTVAIIFQGKDETSAAVAAVEKNLNTLSTTAGHAGANVKSSSDAINKLKDEVDAARAALDRAKTGFDGVGSSSSAAAEGLQKIVKGFSDTAKEAGASNDVVDRIEVALLRFAGSSGPMAALVATLATLGVALIKAGGEAREFKIALDNFSGGAIDSGKEFEFVQEVAMKLSTSITSTGAVYSSFLQQLEGTGISAAVAQNAFEGILAAFKGQGQSVEDASKGLSAFISAASDGDISLKDLEDKISKIPGGLRIFAEALGVPVEELKKLAENGALGKDEIELLAQALKDQDYKSLSPVKDALTDLWNVIKLFANDLGAEAIISGTLWAIQKAIQALTLVVVASTGLVSIFAQTLGNLGKSLMDLDYDGFMRRQEQIFNDIDDRVNKAKAKFLGLENSSSNASEKTKKNYGEMAKGFSDAADQTDERAIRLDKTLKDMGVDPKKFKEPIIEVTKLFEQLARNELATGAQIGAGFEAALKKTKSLEDLGKLGSELVIAYSKGKLSSDEFAKATAALAVQQDKILGPLNKTKNKVDEQAKAMAKQAEETRKAEESAKKYAIEMEKIASNERIKTIEARVKLNVAQIEADTARVKAAFESLNKGIESTGKVTEEILKGFKDIPSEFDPRFKVFEQQLQKETSFREQQFRLQKELTEAQIQAMRAQTKAMEAGDAFIKIDGSGLQPHLEAFMWEILRTIQARVNRDGLKMLLGAV